MKRNKDGAVEFETERASWGKDTRKWRLTKNEFCEKVVKNGGLTFWETPSFDAIEVLLDLEENRALLVAAITALDGEEDE